jgi:hypothetical protein
MSLAAVTVSSRNLKSQAKTILAFKMEMEHFKCLSVWLLTHFMKLLIKVTVILGPLTPEISLLEPLYKSDQTDGLMQRFNCPNPLSKGPLFVKRHLSCNSLGIVHKIYGSKLLVLGLGFCASPKTK